MPEAYEDLDTHIDNLMAQLRAHAAPTHPPEDNPERPPTEPTAARTRPPC